VSGVAYAYVRARIVTSSPFSVHSISPGMASPGCPRTVIGSGVGASSGAFQVAPVSWLMEISSS
jgi:hypothetical protein